MGKDSVLDTVIGIDQGDRWSQLYVVSAEGAVVRRERIRTRRKAYETRFGGSQSRCRLVLAGGRALPVSEPPSGGLQSAHHAQPGLFSFSARFCGSREGRITPVDRTGSRAGHPNAGFRSRTTSRSRPQVWSA